MRGSATTADNSLMKFLLFMYTPVRETRSECCGLPLGIDLAGESQLVGYPTQLPSVSMMDWIDGKPIPLF